MKKLMASLMIFLCLACNNKNDDNTTSTPPSSGGPVNNPQAVGDLIGTWSKPCASAGDAGGFLKQTITIDPTTATMQAQLFQSSNTCSGTADVESRSSLNYTVPNYTPGQINQINMKVNSIRARINTNAAVAVANVSKFCGFNDWQVGVEKDVAGRNCVETLPAAGQPYYDIFKVQSNQLFTGQVDQAHSGKTPEARPTQLERTPYTR